MDILTKNHLLRKLAISLGSRVDLGFWWDRIYLLCQFREKLGYDLNLKEPKTYNEKIQWLKLYNRRPEYTQMVDKYAVRQYVAETIGEEYLIPMLGIWNNFDDIDFHALPDRFVLKCTHDSGGVAICRGRDTFSIKKARKLLKKRLAVNYYLASREWPYKNVKPQIIAEKFMEDYKTGELRDYKIFTFNGIAKVLFISTDRQKDGEDTKFDFFDMDFNHLDIKRGHPNADTPPERPENFAKMKYLAEKLSQGIPHVRVDFYEVNGKVYFGELTFFPAGGLVPFTPSKWDRIFGDRIVLPEIKWNSGLMKAGETHI